MKKLSLLLASVGAGVLLVGGTVAAYIVSAADSLGVRVTPGNLDVDASGHIQLSWGEKSLGHVSNLAVGQTKQIGEVTLAGASSDVAAEALAAYEGSFKVTLQNQSTTDGGDLLDYLTITAEKWNEDKEPAAGYDSCYVLDPSDEDHAYSVSAKIGDKFRFSVTLSSDATAKYDIVSQQVVYVGFSWGPKADDANAAEIGTLNFLKPASWTNDVDEDDEADVYFYAYKDAKINKIFPGEKMTKLYTSADGDVYSIPFDTSKYTTYVFNDGTHTNEFTFVPTSAQIAAIKGHNDRCIFPEETGANVFGEVPEEQLSALYYVVGNFNGVDQWDVYNKPMTLNSGTEYLSAVLSLKSGDAVKVFKPTGASVAEQWIGPNDNWLIEEDGNYIVCVDESHDNSGGWSGHIYVSKQAE